MNKELGEIIERSKHARWHGIESDKSIVEREDKALRDLGEKLLAHEAGEDGLNFFANNTASTLYRRLTGAPLSDFYRNRAFSSVLEFSSNRQGIVFSKSPSRVIDAFAVFSRGKADRSDNPRKGFFSNNYMHNHAAHVGINRDSAAALKGKSANEVLQTALTTLGIADAEEEYIENYRTQTVRENIALRKAEPSLSVLSDVYKNDDVNALQIWMDSQMWKSVVVKKGWVSENSQAPVGSIQNVTEAFRERPFELMARLYSLKHGHPHEQDPRDALDHKPIIGVKYDRWKLVAKDLLIQGRIPTEVANHSAKGDPSKRK